MYKNVQKNNAYNKAEYSFAYLGAIAQRHFAMSCTKNPANFIQNYMCLSLYLIKLLAVSLQLF